MVMDGEVVELRSEAMRCAVIQPSIRRWRSCVLVCVGGVRA